MAGRRQQRLRTWWLSRQVYSTCGAPYRAAASTCGRSTGRRRLRTWVAGHAGTPSRLAHRLLAAVPPAGGDRRRERELEPTCPPRPPHLRLDGGRVVAAQLAVAGAAGPGAAVVLVDEQRDGAQPRGEVGAHLRAAVGGRGSAQGSEQATGKEMGRSPEGK